MKDQFDAMFLAVLNGKSVRECEKTYGINRNTFTRMCKEIFPEESEQRRKLEMVLSHNKSELQKKDIDDERLHQVVEWLFNGTIKTVTEAKTLVSESLDLQTFQEHLLDYVNKTEDDEIKRKFIEYEARKNMDYSHINFKALIIEMIKEEASQTEMAEKYGIPKRTVSRELSKLENDKEFKPVFAIAKELAKRRSAKGNAKEKISFFTDLEVILIQSTLEKYNEGEVIISTAKSELDKRYEKSKKILKEVDELKTTKQEAAKKLGISNSTIRRAKKTVESYENLKGQEVTK